MSVVMSLRDIQRLQASSRFENRPSRQGIIEVSGQLS